MLTYRTDADQRANAQDRRDRLRSIGQCINGPEVGIVSRLGTEHGPVVSGGKCQRCIDLAKISYTRAPLRYVTIRAVVESLTALALDNAEDRETLIRAIEHRRRCR